MTSASPLRAIAAFVLLAFLAPAPRATAVEHPGAIDKNADCTSCHAKKMTGKSVHSAMSSPCMVCHVTSTQGDMTLVSLSMPKNKICFACHEEAAASRLHTPSVKGQCMECHDAHSSERRMLLRRDEAAPPVSKK